MRRAHAIAAALAAASTQARLWAWLLVGAACAIAGAARAACDPAAPDKPDLLFVDANCDGIDGDELDAIFVAPGGSDSAAGTKGQPKRTISAGIAAAAAVAKSGVFIAKGNYAGNVVLASGVSLYGGYDDAAGWTRSSANLTRIVGDGTGPAVSGIALSATVTLQLMTIESPDATGAETDGSPRSSYGVRIVDSPEGVRLQGVTVLAGDGASAAVSSSGGVGVPGGTGGNASGTAQGSAGSSSCGATGGAGAPGPGGVGSGQSGGPGTQVPGGGSFGAGGSGGSSGSCGTFGTSSGGDAPALLAGAGDGASGLNGGASAALGALDGTGIYRPPISGSGASGKPGGGGGGGGSGGGSANGTNFFCTNCASLYGGAGGGGGGGGCGGGGGAGGRGSGGSFAVVSVSSLMIVEESTLSSGAGGSGGAGGAGAEGGIGGQPGPGAAGAFRAGCGTAGPRSGGAGAMGAPGGKGGRGGGGAGGAGGPSMCVFYSGVRPISSATQCVLGAAGSGGTGGASVSTAEPGPAGVASEGSGLDVPTAPSIRSGPPPGGRRDVAYSHEYLVLGTAPLLFGLVSGALPDGLSLSDGRISGIPTSAGTFTGVVSASNAYGSPSSQPFSITIAPPSPGELTAQEASLDFGGQSMGTTSPALAVRLTNTGTSPVTLAEVSVSNGQFARTHACATIAPAGTCVIQVAFSPAIAAGPLNATAVVSGNLLVASDAPRSPLTVSLAGVSEKSLVTHYYRSILRRAPDATGKQFWADEAARVAGLGANVNEAWFAMAQYFYFSPEYVALSRDDTGFVTDLYATFFNRAPDAGGLAYWAGQLGQGMPREVVLASFMFSAEFVSFTQAIFGNTAARAEVDAVGDFYRGLLARLPDTGGFDAWVRNFRSAQCQGAAAVSTSAEAISSAFTGSAEYANRNRTDAQYVGDLYNAFLRRGGDLAGVQFWIDFVANPPPLAPGEQPGTSRERVRRAFIASGEFQQRVAAIVTQGCLP